MGGVRQVDTRLVRFLAAAAVALIVTAATGCGESVPRGRGVEESVREFLRAAADRDGGTACALLTDSGRAAMAAYPRRATAGTAPRAACERTVERLDRLPGAHSWSAMADGTVTVSDGAGLDAQPVTVRYRVGTSTYADSEGSAVPPVLAVNSKVADPPFPIRTDP